MVDKSDCCCQGSDSQVLLIVARDCGIVQSRGFPDSSKIMRCCKYLIVLIKTGKPLAPPLPFQKQKDHGVLWVGEFEWNVPNERITGEV